MKLAVIADDFTGSNDTGVQFAKKGLTTVVTTNMKAVSKKLFANDVVVFDTESRFDQQKIAYDKVYAITKKIDESGIDLVYKKLDSTFRGNIGAEISACMDGMRCDFAVIIPALPSAKRQTIDGNVVVHGKLLNKTEAVNDPKTPVTKAYIPDIISEQYNGTIETIRKRDGNYEESMLVKQLEQYRSKGVNIVVIDATTEQDVKMLARVITHIKERFLIVGTAGLAEYITDVYKLKESKPVLSIVGSVSDITRRQIDFVKSRDNITIIDFTIEKMYNAKQKKKIIEEIIYSIKDGESVIIRTAKQYKDIELAILFAEKVGMNSRDVSDYIARTLGEITEEVLKATSHDLCGVFITGGDTLIKITNQLHVEGMVILEEVLPAIALGRFIHDKYNNVNIVTKAGAFGNDETFNNILDYLRSYHEK